MALLLFHQGHREDRPIKVFNHGRMRRDFTYIDDIIEGVVRSRPNSAPNPDWNAASRTRSSSVAPYKLYNIGNTNTWSFPVLRGDRGKPRKTAKNEYLPAPGDVPMTHADVDDPSAMWGSSPRRPLKRASPLF
jgi:UDP-glucuronate 4-epimerase